MDLNRYHPNSQSQIASANQFTIKNTSEKNISQVQILNVTCHITTFHVATKKHRHQKVPCSFLAPAWKAQLHSSISVVFFAKNLSAPTNDVGLHGNASWDFPHLFRFTDRSFRFQILRGRAGSQGGEKTVRGWEWDFPKFPQKEVKWIRLPFKGLDKNMNMSKISIGCFGVRTFTTLWYFSDGHGAEWADTKCWLMTGARIALLFSSVGGSFSVIEILWWNDDEDHPCGAMSIWYPFWKYRIQCG